MNPWDDTALLNGADLLDLNRVIRDNVPLDIGVHDLSDVLRSVLDTLADTAASKQIDVEFVETSQRLTVDGDGGRLQQIFTNVLSNALKFTPTSGRVRVIATRHIDTAIVRITDSGDGIAPTFMPHIFDMFRQQEDGTRRRHAGLGIGLAVVKRLVELHRGDVEITSNGAGQGTEVTIRLPVTHDVDGAGGGAAVQQEAIPLRDLTILLVEDVEDSLDATRTLLEVLGASVLVARDGLEALDVMAVTRPDLVLCDLRMPRMDGFEFLRELSRTQGPDHRRHGARVCRTGHAPASTGGLKRTSRSPHHACHAPRQRRSRTIIEQRHAERPTMPGPSKESGRSASGKPDLLVYVEGLRQQAEEFKRALEEEASALIEELRVQQAKRPRL